MSVFLQSGHGHNLGDKAPPAETRAVLLRGLPDEDFNPPDNWYDAFVALRRLQSNTVLPAEQQRTDFEKEECLRDEVGEFAAEFFQLLPEQRKERWTALSAACVAHPMLA